MQEKNRVMAELETINRLAARRFSSPALAEEAALFVLEALEEDDWQRVRSHTGQAPFTVYLGSLTWRLLEDFSRRRFGRRQAPAWLRALGGVHLLLYRLLCLERLGLPEAIEMAAQRQHLPILAEIEAAAHAILEKVVDCRSHQGLEVDLDTAGQSAQDCTAFSRFEDEDRDCFLEGVFAGIFDRGDGGRRAETHAALGRLRLELSSEERLLLKMCYQDGLSVARAGEFLGLGRHQVHGRLRRLLARLGDALAMAGLADELRQLLD